jgi:hypothetical protein
MSIPEMFCKKERSRLMYGGRTAHLMMCGLRYEATRNITNANNPADWYHVACIQQGLNIIGNSLVETHP